jgi:hypothetical protein
VIVFGVDRLLIPLGLELLIMPRITSCWKGRKTRSWNMTDGDVSR